jgi:RNA polymerase sigma-70 factor (ECF subfamily)
MCARQSLPRSSGALELLETNERRAPLCSAKTILGSEMVPDTGNYRSAQGSTSAFPHRISMRSPSKAQRCRRSISAMTTDTPCPRDSGPGGLPRVSQQDAHDADSEMVEERDDSRDTCASDAHSSRGFERDVVPLAEGLYRYALSRTKNAADAEDLVQETMLKAFKAYGSVREDTYFKAWALTIMKHTWISNYRAAERRPAEHLVGDLSDEHLPSSSRDTSEDMLSAEHHALRDFLDPDMSAALHALPEDMRRTVYYIAIEGMKYREAAAVMGVSEGTLMSRMHRIRKELRLTLGDVALQRRLLSRANGRRAA